MVLVGGRWKVLLLLVLPVASFIAGLLVFIQGFLLTRHALLDASTCSDFGELSENGCWMPKKFNKTVLLLIDGLRYDFAAEDDTVKSAVVPAFLNKMPVFKEIISGIADIDSKGTTHLPWRGSGFLAKFIADAPTTTMQRLKGLITGGLPTFIDLAQNFDSGSISEDNLVLQLEQHGRSITVLGDDTWRNLFPNRHVAQSIHDDTLLLVFGDHGMTATGDHGGDSDAEVTAAFFVYSPGLVKNFSSYYRSSPHSSTNTNESNINELLFQGEIFPVGDWRHQTPHLIQQVSLVPTVSLLLGVPIPYSSIGSVVPQLFGSLQDQVMALSLNVKQVHRYLSHYNDKFSSNRFPLSMWQKLVSLKVDIDDIGRINLSNSTHLEAYKSSLKEEAVGKDLEQIKNHLLMRRKSLYEEYLSLAKAMCEEVWATFDVTAMAGGIFLMITRTFEKGKIKNQASISSVLAYIAVSVFIVVGVAVRWSSSYRRCREEQSSCEPSTNYLPLSSIDSALQNKRFFIGVFLLILTVSLPRQWLSYCGNLNGMRAAVFVYRNATIICGVMIATYWALDAVPKPSALILTYMNYPPRVIYALAAITILITFVKPLLIFQLHKNKRQYNVTNAHMLIPELFNNLKEDFGRNKRPDSDCETPVVYGLATAISAPLVTTGSMAAIVVLLLVGDGMALPLLLLILTVAGFCFLHAAICWQNPLLDSVMRLRWVGPVVWCLLSLHGFYSTGHQTTFPTLPWSAAFVGRVETGAGGTLAPALLVLLHTFSGHLLLGLLLPLLPLAPLTLGAILPTLRKKKSGDELQRGEFVLLDRPEVFLASLSSFAVSYVLLTCISCLFLRRHLMMWKIFAPHLIFESVGLVVTLCSVSFSVLLALRTLDVLQTWAIRISFLKEKPS
ncbi:hypothetical protein HAZT_HAZT007914 [Hyalella azteca]|uniref:GPI ethanolamine phosphate transferase 3 n=1 Tax=Hyalella azteca TaxID=294128 RepID=A0A6A0HEF3_HYAAZ|nr:hypothetical protein HAZT_HAZT007914 [Hyalella azteca]